MKKRFVKTMVWLLIGIILLELLLRTAGAAYLLLKDQRASGDNTKDTYIILALGESTTADGGVYSWPSQLETVLNEKSPEREFIVVNGGLVGANTAVILSKLETNLDRYNPDLVITMMGGNDERLSVEYSKTPKSRILSQLEDIRIYKLGALIWSALVNPSEALGSREDGRSKDIEEGLKKDEEAFKEALETNPHNGDAYIGLARTYTALGRYQEAVETYETLLELSTSDARDGTWDEQAYIKLGWLYYTGRQPDSQLGQQHDSNRLRAAEEMFQKALEINPYNGDAYTGLGWVYVDLGINLKEASMFEEAETMFRKAMESGIPYEQIPGFTIHEGLAWAYEGQGMRQEAIETYEDLLELSGAGQIDGSLDEWTYAELGRLYHEIGVSDEEIEEFYSATSFSFEMAEDTPTLEITKHHYGELYRVLDRKGISYVAMQYPTRDINELKNLFEGTEDIIFVSNKENFEQALQDGEYEDYFLDRFTGTFGHATPKGNRLIAENVADAILTELADNDYVKTSGVKQPS